ncbi:MAG: glycerol kinase GlpK [Ruminococcaceae bacterium]|nr:glycerol kinase GlpK [Oscillospiraceae bacterium]
MKKYILALDEGTTSARAILFDQNAAVVSVAQNAFPQYYPKAGWVEQNPMELYAAEYAALTECVAKSGINPREIAAVGITNQRETTVVWDKKTGEPVYPAIVWQCRRTADICEALEKAGHGEYIAKTTGLRIDPYFSGTKIKWILDNVAGARARAERGELAFGTVDTWLLWKLTGGEVFATDVSNASRTMLCNIHTGEWDEKLLSILDIPRAMLPEIRSSSEVYGYLDCMGAKIPIAGIAGDQQSALFGQGCFSAGNAKNTYGTGCFLLAHTGNHPAKSHEGMLTTLAATEKGRALEYALEGSVFVGGAVISWLKNELHLIHAAQDSEYFASRVPDTGGVYIVPAFAGLGAPTWDMHARGTIVGLTAGTGRNHIIRAALESIAFQTEDVLSAMNRDMKAALGDEAGIVSLRVDGGASRNDLLMQMQSDISAIPVLRSDNAEATALGAAFLAGLAVGFFESRDALPIKSQDHRAFYPNIDSEERKKEKKAWARAVCACRAFSNVYESEEI